MQTTEVQRIAKRLNMKESDIDRISEAMDYVRLGKLVDGAKDESSVKFEDCDQVHNDEGY